MDSLLASGSTAEPQRSFAAALRRLAALLALIPAAAACERGAAATTAGADHTRPRAARATDRPIAYIGATPVTLAEIEAPIATEIYAARTTSLRDILSRRLIQAEARRRSVSIDQFLKQEIDEKVREPSEAELRAFFEDAQAKGKIEAGQSFDSVKAEFLQMRMKAMRFEREGALVAELFAAAGVRVDLEGLGRPPGPNVTRGPSVGPPSAKIVLVEYGDLKSPFCREGQATVERLLKDYPSDLRVVFRQKPADGDATSRRAAEASLCAHDQGKYWDFRKAVFAHQGDLSDAALARDAGEAGLEVQKFQQCLDSNTHGSAIDEDVKEARTLGYEGSPVFSLNGTRLSGAHELSTFKGLIDTELTWRAGQKS